MEIFIVSVIYYIDRVISLIEIQDKENDKIIRTLMYRSTGSNVDGGDGYWFPTGGIIGPGLLKRTSIDEGLFFGHINKDLIYVVNGAMYRKDYILRRRDAHSDINMRYKAYILDDIPFDIKEVALAVKKQYNEGNYLPTFDYKSLKRLAHRDVELINSWVFHGLHARTPDIREIIDWDEVDKIVQEK